MLSKKRKKIINEHQNNLLLFVSSISLFNFLIKTICFSFFHFFFFFNLIQGGNYKPMTSGDKHFKRCTRFTRNFPLYYDKCIFSDGVQIYRVGFTTQGSVVQIHRQTHGHKVIFHFKLQIYFD